MKRPAPICRSPCFFRSLCLCLGILLVEPVAPQAREDGVTSDCATALRDAARSYRNGLIEPVFELRGTCLDNEAATRGQKAEAWALLAKAHLVEDEDEAASEAVDALLALEPDFTPALADPARFVRLVREKKSRRFQLRVASVSKADEALREAPATVVVVTAEEIERRGYVDVEEVLHDLPGFDISRGNGDVYSNVYMRGYRSDRSDRLLLLVDGVEHNDLHSDSAHVSRQYPLSNVERIEVVYGPASTIYGANAFNGVISITTRSPESYLAEDRNLGFAVQAGAGSFNTSYVDATVAGRTPSGRLSWSLTGRSFRSDEQDLSDHADWDYDPEALAALDYQQVMRLEGDVARTLAGICALVPQECEIVRQDGEVVAIQPTAELADAARRADQELFDLLQGQDQDFWDATDDWAVDARLDVGRPVGGGAKVRNFVLGVQAWRRREGTLPWYSDLLRAGSRRNVATPRQTHLYARYSQPIGSDLQLSFFARFKTHETADDTSLSRFVTFAGKGLNLFQALPVRQVRPALQEIVFDQKSSQIRNELTLVYQPARRFDLVGGVELRHSSVQLELTSAVPRQLPINPAAPYQAQVFFETQTADSKSDLTDLGVYVQASYKPRDDWKVVAGARLDDNSVRGEEALQAFDEAPTGEIPAGVCESFGLGPFPCNLRTERVTIEDSGSVFNPRLAVVHTRGNFVVKALYAEAFKAPSNFQRFTREPGVRTFASTALEPEKVRNFELGLSWQPRPDVTVDVSAYRASYSNAVALRKRIPQEILDDPLAVLDVSPVLGGEFANLGRLRITGAQVSARATIGGFGLAGNYTYTDPRNLDPVDELGEALAGVDELRIGDIAGHRVNLGLDRKWHDRIGLDLRVNWVGERKTGAGTTSAQNPLPHLDAYLVAHATLSYSGFPAGATWQLMVRNLFDTDYAHPGVQQAGEGFAAVLPQPGRTFFFRLFYKHW